MERTPEVLPLLAYVVLAISFAARTIESSRLFYKDLSTSRIDDTGLCLYLSFILKIYFINFFLIFRSCHYCGYPL
jgi:hypothetical protein